MTLTLPHREIAEAVTNLKCTVIVLQHWAIMLDGTSPTATKMTETLFCYCCRVHHPKEQMRLFPTKQGYRWRCIRSIEAAACSRRERDAFGRQQTEINRESYRTEMARNAQQRARETY